MNNRKKVNWFIEIKKLSEKIEKNEGDKDDILEQIFEIKQDKITGKIYHQKKELKKAIKKAKNFEIQKKIKKIKNIKNNDSEMIIMENKNNINEIKKIEEQINQIKKLKIDEISDKFLYESICQDEILGKHTLLTLYRTSNRPKDNNDNELEQNKNLINNILKANVSKTCIANIINDIKKVIEVFDQNKIEKSITLDDKPKSKSKKRKKAKAKKQKSNSIDFNSEDEDDNGLTSKSYDSMFMSSLNGEENEYSSDEESLSDFIEEKRPKKKNRMGQRERQKLWEKNYGKNANHLKKAREMKLKEAKKEKNNKLPENLHPSWEAKRLLKEKSKIVEFTGKKITFDDNDEDTDMTDSKPAFQNKIKDPKVKKIKELHPSWEAKKLKELKEQAITHSGIKGTKIVFDDDD